jgi:hypothetical protein
LLRFASTTGEADVADNDILFQSHFLNFGATSKPRTVERDAYYIAACQLQDRKEDSQVHETLPEEGADTHLPSVTALLDGALRSTIHESTFAEKYQQDAGIRVQSSSFQNRLSEISPTLWSRGYLLVR